MSDPVTPRRSARIAAMREDSTLRRSARIAEQRRRQQQNREATVQERRRPTTRVLTRPTVSTTPTRSNEGASGSAAPPLTESVPIPASPPGFRLSTTGITEESDLLERVGDMLDQYNLRGNYTRLERRQFRYMLRAARNNRSGSGQPNWMSLSNRRSRLLHTSTSRGRFMAWLYDNWRSEKLTTLELSTIFIRSFHDGRPSEGDSSLSLLDILTGAVEDQEYELEKMLAELFLDEGFQAYHVGAMSGHVGLATLG